MITLERGFYIAMVVIIIIAVHEVVTSAREFKEACEKTAGTTVWDGRQYQCLRKQ